MRFTFKVEINIWEKVEITVNALDRKTAESKVEKIIEECFSINPYSASYELIRIEEDLFE